jgi:hypothetical protein
VNEQSEYVNSRKSNSFAKQIEEAPLYEHDFPDLNNVQPAPVDSTTKHVNIPPHYVEASEIEPIGPSTDLDSMAKPCIPSDASHISRFLVKRDFISSRFTAFDNNPTKYYAWKTNFKNILTDPQVSTLEYLDVLVDWLGPESQRQAKSIRAANIAKPQAAIDLIWE